MPENASASHLAIGAIVYPMMDQIDLTGPFEVLSRIPGARFHIIARERLPIRDMRGLIITPETTLSEVPPLDLLLVPGGHGQEEMMDDEPLLSFIAAQAARVKLVLAVCTGVLLCGAAGLLKGRRATTNWMVHHLLGYFGAIPVNERVVVDGNLVTTAGVTAGIDGALRVALILSGEDAARRIQLGLEYAPDPPFNSGTPATAPVHIVESVRGAASATTEARAATARRIAQRLGVSYRG
jgi:cyclohexyl-isocyanide hydratase